MKMNHIGIMVGDMDKAVAFYTQVLGLKVVVELLGAHLFELCAPKVRVRVSGSRAYSGFFACLLDPLDDCREFSARVRGLGVT